jgi:hypothetical protein
MVDVINEEEEEEETEVKEQVEEEQEVLQEVEEADEQQNITNYAVNLPVETTGLAGLCPKMD